MLQLHNISYQHPDKTLLLNNISLFLSDGDKTALTGNNGAGKSTLLRIIAGILTPAEGSVEYTHVPYYVPQVYGQYDHLTIAQALRVDGRLNALQEILNGNTTEGNYTLLDDDWAIEERCSAALQGWQLPDADPARLMGTLSGGQQVKVFLAGIAIHQPRLILLDEPTNHLDSEARQMLYDLVRHTTATLIVVSHDRNLLNLLNTTLELSKGSLTVYGGNYDLYVEQKHVEAAALAEDIQDKEKALRKAKIKARETMERQQKLDARGRGKQEKAGVARIMMNTLRNNAESSAAKLKSVHTEKMTGINNELRELRAAAPAVDKMRLSLAGSVLHNGKILFSAAGLNHSYDGQHLWAEGLDINIESGERMALQGPNGCGKTSLIKIITGALQPERGKVYRANAQVAYIDQNYSMLHNELSVYEQLQRYNTDNIQEHELKNMLSRFLFTKETWDKPCGVLSGGERMRLALCCLSVDNKAPDLILLDEPTNNLDIQNIDILTAVIHEYRGTLVVVSHDERFREEVGVTRTVYLKH